jgi:hypothetical protein
MTDRVFEDSRSIEVVDCIGSVEVCVMETTDVMIEVRNEPSEWDVQIARFTMTAEGATRIKDFLIKHGY